MEDAKAAKEEAFEAALLCTLHPYLKQDEEELSKQQQSAVTELLQSTLQMSPLDTSTLLDSIARQAQAPRVRRHRIAERAPGH